MSKRIKREKYKTLSQTFPLNLILNLSFKLIYHLGMGDRQYSSESKVKFDCQRKLSDVFERKKDSAQKTLFHSKTLPTDVDSFLKRIEYKQERSAKKKE